MKRPQFITNEIYHIYNRGVEKRNVFMDDKDYFRFIHNLFEFNDKTPAHNIFYKLSFLNSYEVRLRKNPTRKCLVEILAFCLMPNHFHLMVRQKHSNGITEFMRKLGTGYTNYFNLKYKRVGSLFQGKFKAIHLNRQAHFLYLPFYIHLNPLDLIISNWREKEIKEIEVVGKATKFLDKYRWSSYLDYIGNKNFPSITSRKFLLNFFSGPENYRQEIIGWLRKSNSSELENIFLED